MKLRTPTLAVLISLAAVLHGCGGGQNAPSADANTSAKEQAQSWGAYSEGNGQYGYSSQHHVVRSWRNAAGEFSAHLVADDKIGRLTVMSADFSSTLAVLNQGPVVNEPTSVQWIAPNHTEAGILRVGRTLYRMAWNGSQATLSAPIHTLASPNNGSSNHYKALTDAKSVVILDNKTLISISVNGSLIGQVDLGQTLGVTLPSIEQAMAMTEREVLVLADRGLLSVDRASGQARWLDQFDGSHAVNQILWANNESVGYRIHLPKENQWHEQVWERSSQGRLRMVADRVMVPPQAAAVAEPNPYQQSGGFSISESANPFGPTDTRFPTTYKLHNSHIVWCDLPEESVEWTCRGQQMFAYLPVPQTTTSIGILASQVTEVTPEYLTGDDVYVFGNYVEVFDLRSLDPISPPAERQDEYWRFDPTVTNSLRRVQATETDQGLVLSP